ncbi:response regulator [Halarcobacter ebronensis]|uniref:Response regulatory domain-containing protein n=1 Tax=Halarcobacter ebronensis TaxID=1462615 RepID=A0A4Q1AMQ7_9BACT|nr:response regulator [Halarcobacter ebronensis]QKF82776.1 two-component system sensor histidine kinase/response regulator fusion protein [Halarcobacter ebronensis]RXK06800.1 hypothetical protein CRV07_05050 [Halarcobacter ebronensis]
MEKKFEEKILLVDDDAKNLQVAMNILKDYNVIYAQSGEKALELVEKNYFDLILLDIVMPTLSGFEVCKILKENVLTRDIPIIFLTVKDEEGDIVKGLNQGAVDYITKPFSSQVLLKRVELHLSLTHTIKELSQVNKNLNSIVQKQLLDIRKKDELLFKQSKMLAITEMIEMMTEQLTYPLGLIKLQNQALEIMISNDDLNKEMIEKTIELTFNQLEHLNLTIDDFKSFFKTDAQNERLCLNVMVNSAVLFFKDIFIKGKITTTIKGDINIHVNFVLAELKHILIKLLFNIVYLFEEIKQKDKKIELFFSEYNDYIQLDLKTNIDSKNTKYIKELFDKIEFDLDSSANYYFGLHLVKIIAEKNNALVYVDEENGLFSFNIKFFK